MNCKSCEDKGWLNAWLKESREVGPFVFACKCEPNNHQLPPWLKNRKYPVWNETYSLKYVPEYLDTPPSFNWLKHADKKSEEFKRRLHIWGRDYLAAMWKRLEKDPSVLDESGGGDMPKV